MAVYTQKTNINPTKFVPVTSRYADSTVIYWSEKNLLTFETYVKKAYPVSKDDKFMIISKGSEYRPDTVSQLAYGIPDYWWRILEANGMKDIYEFKAGTNIRIPKTAF